jgi:DNA-binding NarL/FixJ family response regulator
MTLVAEDLPTALEKKVEVVIADDSSAVRERLVSMLSELKGVEVVGQAQNVEEAIASIRALHPKAVILDIRMPGGSGINVLQNIKREQPAPVVIILTNYPYLQYRKKCLEAGADFFFDKSTEFNKIPQVFKLLTRDFWT